MTARLLERRPAVVLHVWESPAQSTLSGGALSARRLGQIREIIRVLHREGVAILLVEQNVPLTLEVAERIYIMEKGVVRHHAPAAELRREPAVLHQYLGV